MPNQKGPKSVIPKAISQHEIEEIDAYSRGLAGCPGVGSILAPQTRGELFSNGAAPVLAVITQTNVEVIFDTMRIDRDGGAYEEIAASIAREFRFEVFKVGGFFSTTWLANCYIGYDKDRRGYSLYVGSVAAKRLPRMVARLRRFLLSEQALWHNTDAAMANVMA